MIAERLPQLLDTLGLADVQPILDTHLERAAKEQMTYVLGDNYSSRSTTTRIPDPDAASGER